MQQKNRNFHLIQPAKLLVLIGVLGVVLYLILPSNKEAVERAIKDGDTITARGLIDKISQDKIAGDEYWQQTKLKLELDAIIQRSGGDVTKAVPEVLENYENGQKSERDAMLTIGILRAAGQPVKAAEILDNYEQSSKTGNEAHSDDMIKLKVIVLQENNRTPEAFDAYYHYFKGLDAVNKDDLTKLIELARAGNRMSEIIDLVSDPDEIQRITGLAMNDSDVFERLGNVALAGGNNDVAIQHYQRSLELDASKTYLNAEIAKAYEWSNRPQEAFEYYIKSLGNDDDYAIERLLDLAQGLYKAQDLGEVLAKYPEKIIELDKGLFLARVFLENGDNQAAYDWYNKLCYGEEPRSEVYLEYISVLIAAQEYEKAVQMAVDGRRLFPKELQFNELIGDILLSLLQYEKAFEEYYKLVSNNLNHGALTKTIELGMALGKEDEITALLQKHRNAGALTSSYLYEQLAMSEFRRGNFSDFQNIVLEAHQKDPSNVYLLEKLFLSHQKLGNYEQAVYMVETYPDKMLKNPYIMDYYLDHLINSGAISKAEDVLENYPKDGQFNGDLKDNTLKERYRARIAVLNKDYRSALVIYNELDRKDSLQDLQMIPYLEIAVLEKDWNTANRLIAKMGGLDHEDFYVHASRAYLYQGEETKALSYLGRITTPLKLAHLWRDFGDYYENAGNQSRARDAYRKSLNYLTYQLN